MKVREENERLDSRRSSGSTLQRALTRSLIQPFSISVAPGSAVFLSSSSRSSRACSSEEADAREAVLSQTITLFPSSFDVALSSRQQHALGHRASPQLPLTSVPSREIGSCFLDHSEGGRECELDVSLSNSCRAERALFPLQTSLLRFGGDGGYGFMFEDINNS